MGVAPARVAFVSGVVFSALPCSAAVGPPPLRAAAAALVGTGRHQRSAARVGRRGRCSSRSIGAAWALIVAAAVFGVSIGAAMTAAYTAAAGVLPSNARGAGFGFLSSASLTGVALSPVACGFLAGDGHPHRCLSPMPSALCVLAVLVRRVMIEQPG